MQPMEPPAPPAPAAAPTTPAHGRVAPALGRAALYYAQRLGWPVFPLHSMRRDGDGALVCTCGRPDCGSPAKHPRVAHGVKDATTDADQIEAWWTEWPDAGIAIATGAMSAVVIDIDPSRGGEEAFAELVRAAGGELPETVVSNTGGGGRHLLFAPPTDGPRVTNSANRIATGIDVRADGGYIVAPPSLHASGRTYAWETRPVRPGDEASAGGQAGTAALAPMPAWLLERVRRRPVAPVATPARAAAPLMDRVKRASAYLARMTPAVSGQGGHQATWRAAIALVRGFDLPAAVALDLLTSEFNPRCRPPWSQRELEHKVEGAERDATLAPGYLLDNPRRTWQAPPPPAAPPAPVAPPAPAADADPSDAASGSAFDAPSAREPGDDADEPAAGPDAAAAPAGGEDWQGELTRSARGELKPTYGNICTILRHTYGARASAPRLAFNAMRLCPELDGRPAGDADLGRIREELERVWAIAPSSENVAQAVRQISEERSYHPVRAYIEALAAWDGTPRLARVASDVLGAEGSALNVSMLRRWFVSAIARAMEPGCKVDTALVLVGPQGYRKSTFFAVLGGAFFSDTAMDVSNKDSLMQLAAAWIYEWSELENVTSKKHAAEIKAFVTSRTDTFRPPFARATVVHPRATVIVGTTNEDEFLADRTGSRRFWVVRVRRPIDVATLTAWRDQLWAEALEAYRGGLQWWLDSDEDAERELDAEVHQVEDAWEPVVATWLASEECANVRARRLSLDAEGYLTTADVLSKALKLDAARWGRAEQIRVGSLLLRLGCRKARVTTESSTRVWAYYLPRRGRGEEAVR